MARRTAKKEMMKMNAIQMISWVVITVGAINWGLVGLANVNLVEAIFGTWPVVVQIIYILVGLAGVYSVWGMFAMMNK